MSQTITIRTAAFAGAAAPLTIIYAAEDAAPAGAAAAIWAATGLDWVETAAAAAFKGKQGQALDVMGKGGRRLLVLGSGKPVADAPLNGWTDRGGSLMAKLAATRAGSVSVILDEAGASAAAIAELAAGLRLRHYKFDKYKSARSDDAPAALAVTLHVADPAAAETAIADRNATVEGTLLARDLVNEPANILGPVEFAARAAQLSDLGVEVEILEPEALEKLGMGSLLCVAQGSDRPARLVIMHWRGGDVGAAPLAFVGKGVVFDTGGISIKPAANMEDMKGDMGGAAAVTGLMHTLAARKAPVNAVGVIGLVENMPSGGSVRPGDIVKAMSGTTIEVINTDAEGRLVLADALWYTQDRFKPRFMINLATLTGAIIVALGHEHAGLFSNNDELSIQLLNAGLNANEKLWRMPLAPAYDKMIESKFADIRNSVGRPAGSITAAQFLQRFVNNVPWAHLDIAGTAFGAGTSEVNTSWAPGFGVALLDRLVRDYYQG
ncbi:MAG: leucyl aminopeptidase [Alphaproteobacteria bacterium]|nr:leucyl aminopeptidase [Alphaproteobacteria bacterium]MBU1561763.1 leucyl aminopeptidase [Alphaproteobacteria bacterium]MBU2302963.1 leucyl aminopeptidase [Alphaproteobacteria bacterium]MBU2368750.1 leucyl aminopeptidase [Alphaproteobacteria bacterium]